MDGIKREIGVSDRFKDLDDVVLLMPGQVPPRDWSNDILPQIPRWNVEPYPRDQRLLKGAEWKRDIVGNNISQRTAYIGLRLALSLKSPRAGTDRYLLALDPTVGAGQNITEEDFPAQTPAQRARLARRVAYNQEDRTMNAYCWLAMYSMRLLVKSDDNYIQSMRGMKARYLNFFGEDDEVSDFYVTPAAVAAYSRALRFRPLLLTTFICSVMYTENNLALNHDENERGILQYACYEVFQYTGLHAYRLTLGIKDLTGCSLPLLMTLLNRNITRAALKEIEKLNVFEETDKKTYVRYARLIHHGYFVNLQTKNCKALVYLVGKIHAALAGTAAVSDPSRIAGIEGLGTPVKQALDKVAADILPTLQNLQRIAQTPVAQAPAPS